VKDSALVVAGMATLAAGTFALRFAGQALRARVSFPPWAGKLLQAGAVILLAALVATTALTEGHGFAGFARPAGVLVGGVLAWRKAPFLVVVIAAAAATALLRLLGVTLAREAPDLGCEVELGQAGERVRRP
jgi:branched-subunit amino acid transport protein